MHSPIVSSREAWLQTISLVADASLLITRFSLSPARPLFLPCIFFVTASG